MSGPSESFVDKLVKAAADNPLAAALVGGGALWLLAGSSQVKSLAGPLGELGERVQRSAGQVWDDGHSALRDGAEKARATIGEGINQTMRGVREGAANTGEVFDLDLEGARDVTGRLARKLRDSESLAQAQSTLSSLLERQPLVLGAVGLTIGAIVAGAISRTDVEDNMLGELSDSVVADLKQRAGTVSQSLQQGAEALKTEIAEAGADLAGRLQETGQEALDAGRNAINADGQI